LNDVPSDDLHVAPETAAGVLGDPMPKGRLLDTPFLAGRIKLRDEDFIVDELPLYEPTGEGEHLYIRVQKKGLAHSELVERLRRHFNVKEEAIGAAGMKDRVAMTSQTISVHLPGRGGPPAEAATALEDPRIQIVWADWHTNKLRRGHLQGNRFSIRIRDLDPLQAPQVWRSLKELEKRGVPNHYGTQRFGYRRNTHRLGAMILRSDWDGLVAEMLGASGSWFPAHQRSQREAFDAGQFDEAMKGWGRRDVAERSMARAIAKGRSSADAVRTVSRHMRTFWVSALQSSIFNHLLEERLAASTVDQLQLGDVAFRHENRKSFLADAAMMAAEDQQARVDSWEISPAGPIIGPGMPQTTGIVLDAERKAFAVADVEADDFSQGELDFRGTRRPYRVRITDLELDSGFDEHGTYVRAAFDLPRGSYATVVLREIIGDEGVEAHRRDRRDKNAFSPNNENRE
jgi:tRNA pseudouridine13 synthase